MKVYRWCLSAAMVVGLVSLNGCDAEAVKKAEETAKNAATQAETAAESAAQQAASSVQNKLNESMNEAMNAVRGVDGGSELVQSIRDIVGNIASTLAGVKDEASATSAAPELTNFSESLGKMNETFAKLPGPAKEVLAGIFESALGDLKPQVEKILALPGVDKILKPVLDGLLEKLGSFKAS
jgi:hypothetical protein